MKIKSKKKFRPVRDLNPWPLWYWCSALPTELTSQLGAGHYHNVGSCNKPMKWWINAFKYIEIIYVNCGLRNEFGSDLRRNEHYLSSTENKASSFFEVFFSKAAPHALLFCCCHILTSSKISYCKGARQHAI